MRKNGDLLSLPDFPEELRIRYGRCRKIMMYNVGGHNYE